MTNENSTLTADDILKALSESPLRQNLDILSPYDRREVFRLVSEVINKALSLQDKADLRDEILDLEREVSQLEDDKADLEREVERLGVALDGANKQIDHLQSVIERMREP